MARILVVEDDNDIRELIRLALEMVGHEVLEARSGEEGLLQAQSHKPEMVLMDLSLAGELDGAEATRRLRNHATLGSIPIVALTAHAMRGDRERVQHVGFTDYWTKPIIDLEKFTRDVGTVLDKAYPRQST